MCRRSSKHRSSVRRAVLRLQQHSKKRILITTMATSSIHALIQSKRYSPELIGDLEKHLQGQFDQKTYDFEANLALLKLYQFHPHKSDKAAIAKVLIKALMQMPSTDFLLCSYQVPERIVSLRVRNMFVVAIHHHAADVFLLHNKQADASLAKLFKLAGLLESGKFKDFWAEANESRDVLSVAPEFDESIRKFIVGLLSITYQTITRTQLSELVNLDDAQLNGIITAQGWKTNTPTTVTFAPSEELQAKAKKLPETFTLEQMAKVLTSIQH